MPWSKADVPRFNKNLTDAETDRWLGAANGYLETCLADGGSAETCEASAIKIANAAVKESQRETNGLGEKILEAVFDEHATIKATVQGFLKAAHAIAKHPNVPAKFKKRVEEIRADLAAHKWADMIADDSGGTPEAVGASEAVREALQSIARRQVRSRLREMSLGGVSVSEFETKLTAALTAKLGTGYEFRLLDIYENAVIYAAEGGMWGAPYTVGLNGAITIGEPIRVKRICRYVPEGEPVEQKPEDRDDQGGDLQLPDDWWKYSQWPGDGIKVLGSTPTDTGRGPSQEALREQGSIIEAATFNEDGALVEVGGPNG